MTDSIAITESRTPQTENSNKVGKSDKVVIAFALGVGMATSIDESLELPHPERLIAIRKTNTNFLFLTI
jgi:hypothetical protein